MSNEWAAVAAVAAIGGFGLAFATFWLTFGGRIGNAETAGAAAQKAAEAAQKQAKEADDRIAVLTASFALYREQVAREYIHRDVMREVEDRLTSAIGELGKRLDRFTEAALQRQH